MLKQASMAFLSAYLSSFCGTLLPLLPDGHPHGKPSDLRSGLQGLAFPVAALVAAVLGGGNQPVNFDGSGVFSVLHREAIFGASL
jgi:hypothetical protein